MQQKRVRAQQRLRGRDAPEQTRFGTPLHLQAIGPTNDALATT